MKYLLKALALMALMYGPIACGNKPNSDSQANTTNTPQVQDALSKGPFCTWTNNQLQCPQSATVTVTSINTQFLCGLTAATGKDSVTQLNGVWFGNYYDANQNLFVVKLIPNTVYNAQSCKYQLNSSNQIVSL